MTAPQQPRGAFWGRFWRTLTGAPAPAATCRPVSVLGADGEPVHTRVLGDAPMSDESRAAFGEIVRAAQRRHVADLRAKREAADEDVRAVARVLQVYGTWPGEPVSMTRLRERFADRIAALDARDTKAPGQQHKPTDPDDHRPYTMADYRDQLGGGRRPRGPQQPEDGDRG